VPSLELSGLVFHVEEHGMGGPLVLLHGFTGSSESWMSVRDLLATKHRVVAIDIVGHGRSDAPREVFRYRFASAVDDLAEIVSLLAVEPATWVGYSMGGRLALGVALQHPLLLSALVLESASPGIESATERSGRRDADEALARRIDEDGVAAFVADWERLPMWQSQQTLAPALRARQRGIRLGQRAVGLANSLRGMGQGAQPPLWDRLAEVAIPVLVLAGARDEKYVAIARRMANSLPCATLRIVPDAGHAIHLEQPERYAELIADFRHGRAGHCAQAQEALT
jgi:2-succinyl-6-hydroxy-2,4-cyclohexadiene-1-carboxylate synthase